MPRQIDDDEYNRLVQQDQIANFIGTIYNDPALTNEAKALIKKKYPQLSIPDYDIPQQVNQKLDSYKREQEEAERRRQEKEQEEHFKQRRKETQEQYGFTDDAMGRLEKMMVERNIGDYEVAATYMATKEPPKPMDGTFDSTRWHHERNEGFADIAKDPEAWARNEIMGALTKDQQRMKRSY